MSPSAATARASIRSLANMAASSAISISSNLRWNSSAARSCCWLFSNSSDARFACCQCSWASSSRCLALEEASCSASRSCDSKFPHSSRRQLCFSASSCFEVRATCLAANSKSLLVSLANYSSDPKPNICFEVEGASRAEAFPAAFREASDVGHSHLWPPPTLRSAAPSCGDLSRDRALLPARTCQDRRGLLRLYAGLMGLRDHVRTPSEY